MPDAPKIGFISRKTALTRPKTDFYATKTAPERQKSYFDASKYDSKTSESDFDASKCNLSMRKANPDAARNNSGPQRFDFVARLCEPEACLSYFFKNSPLITTLKRTLRYRRTHSGRKTFALRQPKLTLASDSLSSLAQPLLVGSIIEQRH